MAAAWCQLAIVAALCLTGAQARPNPVQIQLDMLEADSVAAIRKVVTHCGKKLYQKTSKCVALDLYNYNCRVAHGPHVLACVPPTGHHTVGLVTACLPGYFIKHPRGKPACFASAKPHKKPHAKPHKKPHAKPTKKPAAKPTKAPAAKPTKKPSTPSATRFPPPAGTTPTTPAASPPPPAAAPTTPATPPPPLSAAPPPPLGAQRVILISVDGLHVSDLQYIVTTQLPNGNLSYLAGLGTTYTNASTSAPSDSFPGIMALHSGGTFKTHGLLYDNTYDRSLYAPGNSNCTGPSGYRISIDETLEFNDYYYNGGVPGAEALSRQLQAINPVNLPYRKNNATGACELVIPNTRVLSNTIFDLVQSQKGGYTAWADKGFEYQILQGKTGKAVQDLYTPEIAATKSGYNTGDPMSIMNYDQTHTNAILNWIKGNNSAGLPIPVPTLFGANYQTVSVSQKVDFGGYTASADNVTFTPTATLQAAFLYIDNAIGSIINELKAQNLFTTTSIIITAKHGQSPRNPNLLQTFKSPNGRNISGVVKVKDPIAYLATALNDPSEPAGSTTDDVALIWLNNQSRIQEAVTALQANATELGIAQLFYPGNGIEMFGNPLLSDPLNIRVPDIAVRVVPGTIYTNSLTKIAEHGGFNPDDFQVAMLGYGPYFGQGRMMSDPVQTTQVAWTICQILGLDCSQLAAATAGEDPKYTVPLPTMRGTGTN